MHLVAYGPRKKLKSFYKNQIHLARPDSLPNIFRKLRQNHNLTKRSLADKFGVSEGYVSAVESGSKFPSISFCLQAALEFDINPKYVKNKWCKEAIDKYSARLLRRLGLED